MPNTQNPTENNLGAPTDGSLGQNVTFAFNSNVGAPQLDAGDPGTIRAGVVGGPVGVGATRAQGVQAPQANPTLDALLKVGGAVLAPVIQRKKEEAYIGGMQRAMQGEAVTDIVKSVPWYSKVFGFDADTIEGARAYSSNAIANTTVNSMVDKMPELRQMDGPTAQAYYVKAIDASKTGDTATDFAVMQSMQRALPGLMRQQAKEHFAYKQERATAAEDASFKSGAASLQGQGEAFAKGYITPEEMAVSQKQFVRAQVPAAGRDMKNWQDATMDRYINAGRNGDFHVVNAGKTPLEPGAPAILDLLKSDQRAQIEAAIEAGENKMRTKYSIRWSDDLANIETAKHQIQPGGSTQELANTIDGLNARYQKETGSGQPFILPRERAAYLSSSQVAIQKEYALQAKETAARSEKLAEAGLKEQAAAVKDYQYDDAIVKGRVGTLVANPKFNAEEANVRVVRMYQSAPTPADQDDLLVRMMGTIKNGVQVGDGYVSEPIAKQKQANFNSVLSAGALTDDVKAVIQDASRLHERDQTTFDKYYGPLAPKISAYLNDVKYGGVPQGAFIDRFVNTKTARPNDKELSEGVAAVSGEYESRIPFYGNRFAPGQARHYASALAERASEFSASSNGDMKAGFVRAMKANPDMEVQGGYVFRNNKGQTPLGQYLTSSVGPGGERPIATDDTNEVFKNAVEHLLYGGGKEAGVLASKASDVLVYRLHDDTSGVPQFSLAANVDGVMKEAYLSAKDIYKLHDRHKVEAARDSSPVVQKQEALRKAVQTSREQARAATNAGIATQ